MIFIIHMDLSYLQTAVTHTSNDDKYQVIATWLAPPAGTGAVRFRCFYSYVYVCTLTLSGADLKI